MKLHRGRGSGRHDLGAAHRKILALCIVTIAAALTACSSKQDASAGNFERALNTWLGDQPLCTAVTPMTPGEADVFLSSMKRGNATQIAAAERVREGLSTKRAILVSAIVQGMFESSSDGTPERVRILEVMSKGGYTHGEYYTYTPPGLFGVKTGVAMLNEEGIKLLRENTAGNGIERRSKTTVCYGNVVVDKIVRWSAPADLMGHRVSEVEYTVTQKNVPPWALPMLVYLKPEHKALLVLTSDGWTVDDSSRSH